MSAPTNPTSPRSFHLGDILSVTTAYLVAPRGIEAMYDLLGFMTDDSLFTHQLARACEECVPALLEQHPQLRGVGVPEGEFDHEEWLAEQVARFGETLPVVPLPEGAHARIDAIAELLGMVGRDRVIAVELPGEVSSQ